MKCPGCGGEMVFRNSGGTIMKRIGRTIVGGALGAVAGPPGVLIGAGIGATRKGKKDSAYWECSKCGYFEYIKRD